MRMRQFLLVLVVAVSATVLGAARPADACCTIPPPPPCATHPEMCA